MRIYDHIEDVPDSLLESREKFIVISPPEELIENKGMVFQKHSPVDPITWAAVTMFALKIILVTIAGTILILALQQGGYILHGRPGQKIDKNMFEGGDGSVWVRDPATEEWKMVKGPTVSPWLWAIVAIGIIVVIIIIYISIQKEDREKVSIQKKNKRKESKKGDKK